MKNRDRKIIPFPKDRQRRKKIGKDDRGEEIWVSSSDVFDWEDYKNYPGSDYDFYQPFWNDDDDEDE